MTVPAPNAKVAALVLAADMAGTFLFAIEGALAAIHGRLDLLGIMVLSFATALGGGVARDLLIGAVPPNAIRDWRYPVIAFAGGGLTFLALPLVQRIPPEAIIVLDAAGLALFAVAGAEKALAFGINPFVAILLGTITAVGGGTLRDVLLAHVPSVLRIDVYASAAMFGAAVVVAGRRIGFSPRTAGLAGGLGCFVLRLVSVWQHWNLPRAF